MERRQEVVRQGRERISALLGGMVEVGGDWRLPPPPLIFQVFIPIFDSRFLLLKIN